MNMKTVGPYAAPKDQRATMKMKDAIRLALLYAHQHGWLPSGVWGQDNEGVGLGAKGGVLAETQGLPFAHNTILNERAAAWLPYGAAFLGLPAVGVMQFPDYQHNCYDIFKMIGETCWSSGGRVPMPVVILAAYGALSGKGAMYHSQTPENEMVGLPGWKVVSVSTPQDAATLLVAAIRDPNPVYIMYPRAHAGLPTDSAMTKGLAHLELPGFEWLPGQQQLMEQTSQNGKSAWLNYLSPPADQRDGLWVQQWPQGLEIPTTTLGTARIRREGDYAVIFSHGRLMPMAWRAAESLSFVSGQQIALMDLRTLKPAPVEEIKPYLTRCEGRAVFLNEATAANNWMKTLMNELLHDCGWSFETYPVVVCAKDAPIGQALAIEKQIVPQIEDLLLTLFGFFTPEALQQIGQRVGLELERTSAHWFTPAALAQLAGMLLSYAEQHDPVFNESNHPLRSLAKA